MRKSIEQDFSEVERIIHENYLGRQIPKTTEMSVMQLEFVEFARQALQIGKQEHLNEERLGSALHGRIMKKIGEFSDQYETLANAYLQADAQYLQMINAEREKGVQYPPREKHSSKQQVMDSLYQILRQMQEGLMEFHVVDSSIKREQNAATDLGISSIIGMPDTQEAIDRQFTEIGFKSLDIAEGIALDVFWLNKLIKYIQTNQECLMIRRDLGIDLRRNTIRETSNNELAIALKRMSILRKAFHLFDDCTPDSERLRLFSNVVIYMTQKSAPETIDDVQFSEESLALIHKTVKKVPSKTMQEFEEIEKRYNALFGGKEKQNMGTFLLDCVMHNNSFNIQRELYHFKDVLTRGLINELILDRSLPARRYTNWGIEIDKDKDEQDPVKNILSVDLPRLLKTIDDSCNR